MSPRPALEVAEVFRSLPQDLYNQLSVDKRRVVDAIVRCRTSELGVHISECGSCGHREHSYNSCRNRHCPKCQGARSAQWTEGRGKELLPVAYFHTVFTVPKELRELAYRHKRVFYELMFRAVSETMKAVAGNEKFLGASISFYAVLHTWNQKLEYHPHLHVVSPKGGLSFDKKAWVTKRADFFLPVRALSKVYRGKLSGALRKAFRRGELPYVSSVIELERIIGLCHRSEWVVYSKRSFGGPTQVVKYLSSYVHRVGISNHRLQSFDGESVSFRYRDPERKSGKKILRLSKQTFSNRFLLHVLPRNFTRIRHYGFLASPTKRENLKLAKELIVESVKKTQEAIQVLSEFQSFQRCEQCQDGQMRCISWIYRIIPHRLRGLQSKVVAQAPPNLPLTAKKGT